MIGLDAIKVAAAPWLGWIKWGAVAIVLAGLVYWHYSDRADAVAAGKKAVRDDYEQVIRQSKEDAAKRLADQRAIADRTMADYIAAQAEHEKQIRIRQNALRKSTAALADCRLGRDVVRLLNDSRTGATGRDRPAVGATGSAVPRP